MMTDRAEWKEVKDTNEVRELSGKLLSFMDINNPRPEIGIAALSKVTAEWIYSFFSQEDQTILAEFMSVSLNRYLKDLHQQEKSS